MKKYIVAAGLFLLMNSCLNNDFMEVYPKDQQTELTSFRSYENFKTYSWGLYNVFFGYAYKTWSNLACQKKKFLSNIH